MTNERIRSDEAARIIGLSRGAFNALAKLRGWHGERDGRYFTYDRATVEREAKARAARNAHRATINLSPADRAHAVRCAAMIRIYWKERGHKVECEAVGAEIVSDTRNGLPVK
jgi:hypothetical protein